MTEKPQTVLMMVVVILFIVVIFAIIGSGGIKALPESSHI